MLQLYESLQTFRMALRPFRSGAAALRISAATLSFDRTLDGQATIIFFFQCT